MQLTSLSLALTRAGFRSLAAFTPASLFAAGDQGVFFDPSDFSSLFTDSAGTTPVTALEQPVGLMLDKSKGLVLGPELVVNGTFDANVSGWTPLGSSIVTWDAGRLRLEVNSGNIASQPVTTVPGRWYRVDWNGTSGTGIPRLLMGTAVPNGNLLAPQDGAGVKSAVFLATSTVAHVQIATSVNTSGLTAFFDNISVRELPGNHATQPTATSRPVVSARVNLLTATEDFSAAAWLKTATTITANAATAPDGTSTADALLETATTNSHFVRYGNAGAAVGIAQYRASLRVKANGRTKVQFFAEKVGGGQWAGCTFNLSSNTFNSTPITAGGASFVSASIVDDLQGFKVITVVATSTASGMDGILVCLLDDAASETVVAPSYAGDASKGIYIWGADLRVANDGVGIPSYQRVNTATDYDSTGFPVYLRADGVDDGMVTNSIDFTATDKMTVVAGVRKLSDAAVGFLAELSVNSTANNGSFWLAAPVTTGVSGDYGWRVQGTAGAGTGAPATIARAPISSVVTGTGSIGASLVEIRLNSVSKQIVAISLGTGNFGNYPLYLFQRGGSSFPFNGRFYGITIISKLLSTTELAQLETYTNGKTRAFA
jgi:hypothetical protein